MGSDVLLGIQNLKYAQMSILKSQYDGRPAHGDTDVSVLRIGVDSVGRDGNRLGRVPGNAESAQQLQ